MGGDARARAAYTAPHTQPRLRIEGAHVQCTPRARHSRLVAHKLWCTSDVCGVAFPCRGERGVLG